MHKIRQLLVVLSAFLLMSASIAVPVYAEGGSDSGSGGSSGSSTGSTSSETGTSTSGSPTTSGDTTQTDSSDARTGGGRSLSTMPHTEAENEFKARGQQLLEQAKKEHGDKKTADQLKQVCEARKQGIKTRTTTLSSRAQESLTRINGVFTKVTTYVKTNNLTVTNYDTLVAAATDAQTKAKASVAALEALDPTVDCSNPSSVTTDIATFKAALTQARTDLKDYRTAVKNLLVAVEQAKDVNNSPDTTTGGQQ